MRRVMADESAIDDASLVERVVLLGVIYRSLREETPTRLDQVRSTCNERLDEVTGRLSEADVGRSLNELSAAGVLDEASPADRSPVGKGRPAYVLDADVDGLLDALTDDDQVEPLVATVREEPG